MFYTMYLDGLCKRRHWPQPLFQPTVTREGYACVVRVNNREYSTDVSYTSEALARDAAATRAYMICRNFSVNDGMYPGQKPGDGAVQGIPVAIGVGRKTGSAPKSRDQRRLNDVREEDEDEDWTSGGSSPRSVDSAVAGLRNQKGGNEVREMLCSCRRARVFGQCARCQYCLREAQWLPPPPPRPTHASYGEWDWTRNRG